MTQEAEALFYVTPAKPVPGLIREQESGPPMADGFPLKAGMTFLEGVSVRGGRRSNLRVIVGTKGCGEIAAASLGWPRNDIGKNS